MKHARRLALFALPMVALIAASCGGGGGGNVNKIVIWEQMDPQERARFEANLDAYRAQHPDLVIEHLPFDTEQLRNQFQTAAAAGGGPDLVFGPSDQIGPLSLLGLIRPLDETMPAGFFDRFAPEALDTLENHLWAAPDQIGNHLVLCYNRALVANAPESYEEFLAAAKRHTGGSGASGRYGFVMNQTEPYWLVPFFAGFGGWVMDEERNPTLDTPAMVAALGLLRDLKTTHGILPRESDYQVAETLFKEGRAAMLVNGPWSWAGYREAGIDLGVAPIFQMPNGQWASPMVASKGYSVNKNVPEDKLPKVLDLLTYLTSAEAQLRQAAELGILPSHRDALADSALMSDPTMIASREALSHGRRMPVVPEMRVIWDAMRPAMQDVMNGRKTPEQAARDMQTMAVERIAATKR